MANTSEISALFVDIIVVVDESGSMSTEHAWISGAMQDLNDKLEDAGIGENQYSLFGYGGTNPDPRTLLNMGTIAQFATATSSLTLSGGQEDGYEAMDFAIDQVVFRVDSLRLLILITDEDRDVRDASITKQLLFNKLIDNNIQLNTAVNATFTNGSLGVNANGLGLFDTGGGKSALSEGQTVIAGFGSTVEDYVEFAWSTGGSSYDLNILRQGGSGSAAFADAFVQMKLAEITGNDPNLPTLELCNFTIDPDNQTFFCEEDEENAILEFTTKEKVATKLRTSEFLKFVNEQPADRDICFHFRLNIYANPSRTSLVYSAFSMLDQRRWYKLQEDKPACQLHPDGVVISSDVAIPEVFYIPEVLPASLIETQRDQEITIDGFSEVPLLCGVTYFLVLEAYAGSTFYHLCNTTVRFSCANILRDFWRDNVDAKRWISSGQGKNDWRISRTPNQAIMPSVAANGQGNFAIAWQDFRENKPDDLAQIPDLFYGIWESSRDIFWSSGQGRTDVRGVSNVFEPKVIADPGNNFVFSGANGDTITRTFCPQPTVDDTEPALTCVFSDDKLFDIDNSNRDADQYLKVRVYEPDTDGSYALSADNVVSVIRDCFVRLDVIGAPGTYAVRLRNDTDSQWSSWININDELVGSPTQSSSDAQEETSAVLSAYFIETNRFIVPWVMSAGNGIKRVCLQILTYFGITQVFCLDVFSDISEIDYKVEFAYDETFTNPAEEFNGLPAIRHKVEDANTTTVYLRITFSDTNRLTKYQALKTARGFEYLASNEFTFNFVQPGVNNQYQLPLTDAGGGIYTGSILLQKSDGIYNKDGLCAVSVNVPNPCTKLRNIICSGSKADFLNANQALAAQDFQTDYSTLDEINAEHIVADLKQSKMARHTGLESFRQQYNRDDPRFAFGNPKFFIKQ